MLLLMAHGTIIVGAIPRIFPKKLLFILECLHHEKDVLGMKMIGQSTVDSRA